MKVEYVWLLPALERSLEHADEFLVELLEKQGLPANTLAGVSREELVLTGLRSHSARWFAAAVTWLEQGLPISDRIARVVDDARRDSDLPQRIRQAAFALTLRSRRPRDASSPKR